MAGPGGKTVGKIGVRVLPDTSAFGRSLERYLQRIERTLRVQIRTELDTSHIENEVKKVGQKAAAGKIQIPAVPDLDTTGFRGKLAAFQASLKNIQVKVDVDTKDWASKLAFLRVSTLVLGAATASIGFPGIAQGLGALTQAAVGLAALAPAAIAAAGAIGVTLAVGFNNFGKALKDSGDPKKFAADLKLLAPAAAQTAIAIHGIGVSFKSTQLAVQQALFVGMAATLKEVANNILPTVSSGLKGMGASLNGVFKEIAFILSGSFARDSLSAIFNNTRVALDQAAPSLALFTSMFLRLAAVGSDFLPRLGAALTDVTGRLAIMVQEAAASGRLADFIDRALNSTTALAHIVGDLGSILGSVFHAASASGADFFGVLGSIINKVAEFFKSASGQSALVAIFSLLRTLGQQVGNILGEALKIIGPLVVQLAPSLSRIAEVLGGALLQSLIILSPILNVLPPILKFIADIITTLEPVLKPLATGILAAAIAFGVFNLVMTVLNGNPVILLLIAIAAIATLIIKNWGPISDFFTKVGKAIAAPFIGLAKFFMSVVDGIVAVFTTLGRFFADLWNGIVAVAKSVWNGVVGFFSTVFKAVADAVKAAWDFISNIILGVSRAIINSTRFIWEPIINIIGSIISIVVDIVRIIVLGLAILLIAAWNGIVAAAKAAWDVITSITKVAWQIIQTVIIDPVKFIASVIGDVIRGVVNFLKGAWDTISGAVRWVWDFIVTLTRNTWNTIGDAIGGPIRFAVGVVRDAVNGIVNVARAAWDAVSGGVHAAWDGIIGFFRGIGGRILDALGDLGGLLVRAGRAIIDGLLSGIRAAFDAVKNFVGGIADWISSHKGPIAKDRKLLVPHGNAIMDGLLGGLKEGQKGVLSFLDGFMADISGTSIDLTAGGLGVAGSGKTGAPGVINVFPQPGQSEEAIASAAYRKFAFAGRISS